MSGPKFRDRKGRLTAYAFAKGYEEWFTGERLTTKIWMEKGVYHVYAWFLFKGTGKQLKFTSLKDARRWVTDLKREYLYL